MGVDDPRTRDPGYIVAKLQRFYHAADPLTWLDMPEHYRAMFSRAMPRLEAEESERFVRVAAAATGHLSDLDTRQFLRELKLIYSGYKSLPRQSIKPKTAEELAMLVGDIRGFKVVME